MIRISNDDFQKLLKLLTKEQLPGAYMSFKTAGSSLEIKTVDRSNKEMLIEISDVEYPFMPKVTKTETF